MRKCLKSHEDLLYEKEVPTAPNRKYEVYVLSSGNELHVGVCSYIQHPGAGRRAALAYNKEGNNPVTANWVNLRAARIVHIWEVPSEYVAIRMRRLAAIVGAQKIRQLMLEMPVVTSKFLHFVS